VSLSVVVPTSRLVCVLCALSAVSLRLCAAYHVFLDSGLAVVCLLCSPGRCVGRENLLGYCWLNVHLLYVIRFVFLTTFPPVSSI